MLTILSPQQAADDGLLGLAYGGAFLSGCLVTSRLCWMWLSLSSNPTIQAITQPKAFAHNSASLLASDWFLGHCSDLTLAMMPVGFDAIWCTE